MSDKLPPAKNKSENNEEKVEVLSPEDYYWENGFMVMTEAHLKKRGYCCQSGCRHCPYGFTK